MTNTTPSSMDRMNRTSRSLPTIISVLLAAGLLATAGAGVTKTRFDLDRSQLFKQVWQSKKPRVAETMLDRWTGVVPPWHQKVLGVELPPVPVVAAREEPTNQDDPTIGFEESITIIPVLPTNPERSHDSEQEEPEITDHGGWEEVIFSPVDDESDLG